MSKLRASTWLLGNGAAFTDRVQVVGDSYYGLTQAASDRYRYVGISFRPRGSFVRVAKNNRPIGLNQNIKRKRSEIKWIGRLFCA